MKNKFTSPFISQKYSPDNWLPPIGRFEAIPVHVRQNPRIADQAEIIFRIPSYSPNVTRPYMAKKVYKSVQYDEFVRDLEVVLGPEKLAQTIVDGEVVLERCGDINSPAVCIEIVNVVRGGQAAFRRVSKIEARDVKLESKELKRTRNNTPS